MSEEKKRETVRKTSETPVDIEKYMAEEVEIELFYDGDKYKDDVLVGVNGKHWLIKRGEKVKVPRFVAEVIANSEKQDKHSAMQQRMMSNSFEREAKKILQE